MAQDLPKVDLPAGVESKYLPVRDQNVHYLAAGDPKSPLIVLLHGFPELCYSWRKVLVPLASLGYFVVAPDSRGYGRTTNITDPSRTVQYDDDIAPYSMLNLAHDVLALVFALGHKTCAAVIGHDFGSPVAGHAALIRPDIFKSVIMMQSKLQADSDSPSVGTRHAMPAVPGGDVLALVRVGVGGVCDRPEISRAKTHHSA